MMSFEFLDGRSVQHSLINAKKIWFDETPNEWMIDEEIIFFGKVRIIRKEKAGGDFGMMTFDPIDDARVETLEVNFRVMITFEIFFERGEDSSAEEGNVGMLGGF